MQLMSSWTRSMMLLSVFHIIWGRRCFSKQLAYDAADSSDSTPTTICVNLIATSRRSNSWLSHPKVHLMQPQWNLKLKPFSVLGLWCEKYGSLIRTWKTWRYGSMDDFWTSQTCNARMFEHLSAEIDSSTRDHEEPVPLLPWQSRKARGDLVNTLI